MKPQLFTILPLLVFWTSTTVFGLTDTITTLPFVKLDNLIIVEAEVHGRKGNFILDTGTPGLWLNTRHFEDASGLSSSNMVAGINGRARNVGILLTDLKMPGVKKGVEALVVDLTGIEERKGIQLLGLIGQSVFKNHELLFDLRNYRIQMIPLNRKGKRIVEPDAAPAYEIPFKMKGHIPFFPVEIDDLELFMGFDTGAECNIIDPKFLDQIQVESGFNRQANVTSGWKNQKTVAYRVADLKITSRPCKPMFTIFSSMKTINDRLYGMDLDGLIGMEWLNQQKLSINFKKKVFYIWSAELPTQKESGRKKEKIKQ